MSKKLIAVASAAALALTALVAMPSSAAVGTFAVTTVAGSTGGNGLTADSAYTVDLPSANEVEEQAGATSTAIRLTVRTPGTLDTVRVSSSGGVKVLAAETFDALASDKKVVGIGAASAEAAGTSTSAGVTEFVLYTTSTTATKVAVTSGSQTIELWVQGADPVAYNVALVKAPRSIGTGVAGDFDFKVTDAFGNVMDDATIAATIQKVGPVTISNPAALTYDADRKVHYFSATGTAKGNASIQMELTGVAAITAFGTPSVYFTTVTVGGTLEELVEGLEAQVAALEAKVAAKVTKKRYNSLAKRWNAQNPNDKVKLKK